VVPGVLPLYFYFTGSQKFNCMSGESFCGAFELRSYYDLPTGGPPWLLFNSFARIAVPNPSRGPTPKSLNDIVGAVCSQCGTVISKDDIVAQVRAMSGDRAEDLLRKAGFK
jgi:hypothetical protein